MTSETQQGGDHAFADAGDAHSRVAVVIPCYKVRDRIVELLRAIGPEVDAIYCVDDCCPENSGKAVEDAVDGDSRVRVLYREENGGVGAATVTGYVQAIADGARIVIKMDGDGQMDPRLIPELIRPILAGEADYVKCNRFFSAETVSGMPWIRLLGNGGLSFITKLSTGYWDLFDPTNGYTALEASVAGEIPLDKLHPRYFFESDMLFRLGILRARVVELPAMAVYENESSGLSTLRALVVFPFLHLRSLSKRIVYNYFLRNFSIASLNLVVGLVGVAFGSGFGSMQWRHTLMTGEPATAGTVMLAALPVILGVQLLLSFLNYDITMVPREALHPRLSRVRVLGSSDAQR
ncbi:MAG: glycosyltransferase family 2 protein [Myxococcales bacterium]|jgi:dolichol-phosphate mannosyltransferase|nr:MAG: glycosyltransferase family 2 protein [Myxococcales bacterium]